MSDLITVPVNPHVLAGRKARKVGGQAEDAVAMRLRSLGFLHVRRIETGWRVKRRPGKPGRPSRIVGATPLANVAGDFRAVVPGGRSVLCESKFHAEGNLIWSDLDAHQVRNLNEHHRAGGLSLIAFTWPGTCTVMAWPPPGFTGPRCSISREDAVRLNLAAIPQ